MHKSRLGCLIIDCETDDLDREANFWSKVFGHEIIHRYEPGDEIYRGLKTDPSQPRMLLQKEDHPSRVHLFITQARNFQNPTRTISSELINILFSCKQSILGI